MYADVSGQLVSETQLLFWFWLIAVVALAGLNPI